MIVPEPKQIRVPGAEHLELAQRIFGVTGGCLLLDEKNDVPAIAKLLAEAYEAVPHEPHVVFTHPLLTYKDKKYVPLQLPFAWRVGDLTLRDGGCLELLGKYDMTRAFMIGHPSDGTLQGFREFVPTPIPMNQPRNLFGGDNLL